MIKFILKLLMMLLILLFIALTLFFLLFDINHYRPELEQKLSATFGRKVTIEKIEMPLSLIPTVQVQNIKIANPDGFNQNSAFLTIDSVTSTLELLPLLSKEINVSNLKIKNASLNLTEQNGLKNWNFDKQEQKNTPSPSKNISQKTISDIFSKINVETISVSFFNIILDTQTVKGNYVLKDFNLKQLQQFTGNLKINETPVTLSGDVTNLALLILGEHRFTLKIDLIGAEAKAQVAMTVDNVALLNGIILSINANGSNFNKTLSYFTDKKVTDSSFDFHALINGHKEKLVADSVRLTLGKNFVLSSVGELKLAPTISGYFKLSAQETNGSTFPLFISKSFTLNTDISFIPTQLDLSNANLLIGKSDISANVQCLLSKKPYIQAQVKSEYINLEDFALNTPNTASTPKQNVEASTEDTLPLEKLNLFNLRLNTDLKNIKLGNHFSDYAALNGLITLNEGVLKTENATFKLLGGNGNLSVLIDSATEPAEFKLQLAEQNLNLDSISFNSEFIKGVKLDIQTDLSSAGNTLKTLISNLNGFIAAEASGGVIVNDWFNRLPIVSTALKTLMDSFSFSANDLQDKLLCGGLLLKVKNGVITSDNNLAIETGTLNTIVSGNIDLNSEKMDLSVYPTVNTRNKKLTGLMRGIHGFKVIGPFNNLKTSLDISAGINSTIADLLTGTNQEFKTAGKLCEQALQRPLRLTPDKQKAKVAVVAVPQQQTEEETVEESKNFKEELFDTFFKVLEIKK